MPRSFSPATAEQVVAAVEAVAVHLASIDATTVAAFLDLPADRAKAALELAVDLGFVTEASSKFRASNPLARFVITANQMQKAAVMRVLLESFEPFVRFRERLIATAQIDTAARQTKALLGLNAHAEEIKDTLISLGTYSKALNSQGGGRYSAADVALENDLEVLAKACEDQAAAEARVRAQMGEDAAATVDRSEVTLPLADSLLRAASGDGRAAVVYAGNAVESFLVAMAGRVGVSLTGATGINAKLDKFDQARKLPKKLVHVGKYLGHIRNAADHGIDTDVGAAWNIRKSTGLEYVFVACSFVAASIAHEKQTAVEI